MAYRTVDLTESVLRLCEYLTRNLRAGARIQLVAPDETAPPPSPGGEELSARPEASDPDEQWGAAARAGLISRR